MPPVQSKTNNSVNGKDETSNLEKIPKQETISLRKKFIGPSVTLFHPHDPLKIVRGEGQYMFDEQGNKYLDCVNNVAHVGHCNPHVTSSAYNQMTLLYTDARYLHDNMVLYAKRITSYFPPSLSVVFFVNSGSEANDLATRIARAHTKNKDVITMEGAYFGHLSTMTDVSPYSSVRLNGYKKPNWVHVVDIPDCYRGKYTRDKYSEKELGQLYANDVKTTIQGIKESGRRIAAFMHESMVSCGGQVMIPQGYLKSVYGEIRAAGGVIIADEVQTGFGRMGTHFWGFQTFNDGIVPDIVTLGKPMGNGHPVACVVTTREIAASFREFSPQYYNTFAGNAVSAAVATAVLDVVEEKKLQENANKVGSFLLKGLEKLRDKYPSFIGDVRGSGLFLGIDLVKDSVTKEPSAEIATFLAQRLREERIIMPAEGIYDNVLKIKPPMVFMEEDAEHLLSTLDLICSEIPGKFIH